MTLGELKELDAAEGRYKKAQEDFRKIANFTDAVDGILTDLLLDVPEWVLIRCTLEKIIEIAKGHFDD